MDHHHHYDHHFDSASHQRGSIENETEYIVGTRYFTIDLQVYGFNADYGAIFRVDDTCRPLSPVVSIPAHGNNVTLRDTILRTANRDNLEYWETHSQEWKPIELFSTYGDALISTYELGDVLPTEPSLLGSIHGIKLDVGEEDMFYSYGRPPTSESINKWVENRKALHAPSICPLNNCRQTLRRPHALRDHLLFKFGIKEFKCSHVGCDKLFPTKANCDRHMRDCKAGDDHNTNY